MFYAIYTKKNNIYNIETKKEIFRQDLDIISNIIDEELSFNPLIQINKFKYLIGPILNFETPWCTNLINICKKCGIDWINRIEKFRLTDELIYDKMIEKIYDKNITSFNINLDIEPVYDIKIEDIRKFSDDTGIGFDDNDIEFCKQIFHDKRPTNVELFDLSQSNSEHSRHWFFRGGYKIENDNEINIEKSVDMQMCFMKSKRKERN